MTHTTQAVHGHMQDHESHVLAVEADLEYWRTKRLEPRVLQLHRRGVLTLYDLLRAAAHVPAPPIGASEAHDIEGRIRALEDGLDDYIRGIGLASIDPQEHPSVIEDTRKERGDYDDFFRIAKPHMTARSRVASRSWSTIFADTSTCCRCSCTRCSTRAC